MTEGSLKTGRGLDPICAIKCQAGNVNLYGRIRKASATAALKLFFILFFSFFFSFLIDQRFCQEDVPKDGVTSFGWSSAASVTSSGRTDEVDGSNGLGGGV